MRAKDMVRIGTLFTNRDAAIREVQALSKDYSITHAFAIAVEYDNEVLYEVWYTTCALIVSTSALGA